MEGDTGRVSVWRRALRARKRFSRWQRTATLTGRLLSGLAGLRRRTLDEGVDLMVEKPSETWCIWADANQKEHARLSLAVNLRDPVVGGDVLIVSVTNV